jgi:peptidyl-prolyl cis-trans isomerase SurA
LPIVSTPASASAEIIDRILFLVDDTVVTQSDVMRYMPIYAEVFGLDPALLGSRDGCDAIIEDVEQFVVQATLLARNSQRRELQVRDDELEQFIAERYQAAVLNHDAFVDELEAAGILYEDFEDFIRLNLTRMRMIQLDVGSRVQISEADIDREVALRYPDGLEETFIETSHIFVQVQGDDLTAEGAAEDRMADRVARLTGGESFESIAADNEDGTAGRSGLIGRFSILDLDAEYSRAALGLEDGEISDPVRSSFGLHLIRLESVERSPVDDASEIRDRVHMDLHQAAATQEEALYLERTMNEAFIERRIAGTDWFCGTLGS